MALICLQRKAVEGGEEEAEASSSPPAALPLASTLHPDTGPTAQKKKTVALKCAVLPLLVISARWFPEIRFSRPSGHNYLNKGKLIRERMHDCKRLWDFIENICMGKRKDSFYVSEKSDLGVNKTAAVSAPLWSKWEMKHWAACWCRKIITKAMLLKASVPFIPRIFIFIFINRLTQEHKIHHHEVFIRFRLQEPPNVNYSSCKSRSFTPDTGDSFRKGLQIRKKQLLLHRKKKTSLGER